jgi:DNA polymerase-3 subunit alpha
MKEICDMIVKFANYGFNRGHSAAYGITAWRTAYLKAHYTADFMCSLLDSVATEKDKLAIPLRLFSHLQE